MIPGLDSEREESTPRAMRHCVHVMMFLTNCEKVGCVSTGGTTLLPACARVYAPRCRVIRGRVIGEMTLPQWTKPSRISTVGGRRKVSYYFVESRAVPPRASLFTEERSSRSGFASKGSRTDGRPYHFRTRHRYSVFLERSSRVIDAASARSVIPHPARPAMSSGFQADHVIAEQLSQVSSQRVCAQMG
jgi:hypothetical protein